MKLIFCLDCGDVRALNYEITLCNCQNSGGQYVDKINAEIWGNAIPLGFRVRDFRQAIAHQSMVGKGREFCAFTIPVNCPSVKKL